jgi:hypothetical protein
MEALQDLAPDGAFPDPFGEVLRHPVVDVRLEERPPDLPQRLVDVVFREHPATAESPEHAVET